MILAIDTSEQDCFFIALADIKGNISLKKTVHTKKQSELLLPKIEGLCSQRKKKNPKITGIGVIKGPGGFTSLRTGITVANALAYAWGIPVVGYKKSECRTIEMLASKAAKAIMKSKKYIPVQPHYGKLPHITKAKKKIF